ncbi:MAG: serine/threonine protein phosphatase, partial [Gammaproteobacteria bacterium]|nr:serine/threonine protein phosphatase [Gammaproteobacteria bacterium]
MTDNKIIKAKSFIQAEMNKAELYSFALGTTSLFTTSPAKETPNEDAIALIPVDDRNGVLVVADGVGGMPTGQDASRIAIESLTNAINKSICEDMSLREGILNGIETANKTLCESGVGSATTLAVLELQGQTIRSYHVGDVLILLTGQRGKLKLQNVPHSPVGYAVESGML